MYVAIQKAKETYEKYGNDLNEVCETLGLGILEQDLRGRLKEIYYGDYIAIRKDLRESEKRELIAHALGHHLLHAGNHYSIQKRKYTFGNLHEKQANVFSAYFLMPKRKLDNRLKGGDRPDEIAEHFGVTEDLVNLRLKLRLAYEKPIE